jgi:hypothetical protein
VTVRIGVGTLELHCTHLLHTRSRGCSRSDLRIWLTFGDAPARCCPWFTRLLRTRHGPTGVPVPSGRGRLWRSGPPRSGTDRPAGHGMADPCLRPSRHVIGNDDGGQLSLFTARCRWVGTSERARPGVPLQWTSAYNLKVWPGDASALAHSRTTATSASSTSYSSETQAICSSPDGGGPGGCNQKYTR